MKKLVYLIILTLLISSCSRDADIWEVPQETHKCIITKHYEPLTLDNGEIICGAPSELDLAYGFSQVEHGIPGAYSDTVYYDKFGNILLIKDIKDYRKRVYYVKPEDEMRSKEIIQYGEGRAVLEITRDSNHNSFKIKNTVQGYIPNDDVASSFEEIQTGDDQGRLMRVVRNNKIITDVEYLPSQADKIIESYTTKDGDIITIKSTLVYKSDPKKLLYSKTTQYEDSQATITEQNYLYDNNRNCIFQDIKIKKNAEIQNWSRYIWKYNQNNDIISVNCAFYMNVKAQTVSIDGETMQEIAHGKSEDVFEKDKLWDAGTITYEYKYNQRGEWIYRVAYRQEPKDIIESSNDWNIRIGKTLEDFTPHPIAITVRNIQYYN